MSIIEAFAPIIISFSQMLFSGGMDDTIMGEILLMPDNKVFIDVTTPVHQQMQLTSSNTIIYYPEEHRAFNLQIPNSNITNQLIQQVEPVDSNYFNKLGFEQINQTIVHDTTSIQFLSMVNKKKPSLVTQKIVAGKTLQLIITGNIGISTYTQLDFNEFTIFKEKEYIKNYSSSIYKDGALINKTTYQINEIYEADEDDINRLKFSVPPEIKVEIKRFN